jgi:hypothetical protein
MLEDARTGDRFLLRFPIESCPYLWMWLVYGDWRVNYRLILEPWTSYPNKLAVAVQQGTQCWLEPEGQLVVEVAATLYQDDEGYQGALGRLAS